MSNPILEKFKTFIGKEIYHTPSPFANWLKGTLIDVNEKAIKIEYTIRPDMVNPAQIAHGGILAAMVDEVMGTLVYASNHPNFFASLNLNIDFLSAAPINTKVIVYCEILKKGRNIYNLKGEITNEAGKLICVATSNLIETHRSKI